MLLNGRNQNELNIGVFFFFINTPTDTRCKIDVTRVVRLSGRKDIV